jgi:hypothetical protein
MKLYKSKNLLRASLLMLLTTMIYGCGGGPAVPVRKKMPEFTSFDGIEGGNYGSSNGKSQQSSFAFAPTNVDMVMDGSTRSFVSIQLPDAGNDSAAISLVNTFKPFAMPMIAAWAQQQHQGVMIDLSSHNGSESHRTDYMMEKPNDYNIPLIIVWDTQSRYRVSTLKNLIQDMPAFRLNKVSGDDPSR